jgi:hypothetical protein
LKYNPNMNGQNRSRTAVPTVFLSLRDVLVGSDIRA